jgi:hypothetical protein
MYSSHAKTRAQQRCIPPLVNEWLDRFGHEEYDGRGGVIRYFNHASIRAMERTFGRAPVSKLAEYLNVYRVDSSRDGHVITMGHRRKHITRK